MSALAAPWQAVSCLDRRLDRIFGGVVAMLEERDLYDSSDPRHRELVRLLAEYKADLVRGFAGGERELKIGADEATELLRGLGYID